MCRACVCGIYLYICIYVYIYIYIASTFLDGLESKSVRLESQVANVSLPTTTSTTTMSRIIFGNLACDVERAKSSSVCVFPSFSVF